MKKTLHLFSNIRSIILLFFLSINTYANDVSIGWNPWHPYQYLNSENKLVGLDIDIAQSIAEETGINLQYQHQSWKRHLQLIRSGDITLASGASNNKSRQRYAYFSIPYRHEYVMLFVKKDKLSSMTLNTLSDLSNSKYVIGAENGFYYGEEFANLVKKIDFQEHINFASTTEENIHLLNKGLVDGIFADPITIKYLTSILKLEGKIVAHPLFISRSTIHIMLSKKSADKAMVDKINKAITNLKDNGEILKMIKHWTTDQVAIKYL